MPKNCIVDSGPLAALLDPRERHHVWARETLYRQAVPWLGRVPIIGTLFKSKEDQFSSKE